jgi:transposase-like protein
MEKSELEKRPESALDRVICKYCQSKKVRKYGFIEGTQYYFCNDCRRKFSPNDQLFRMKTPAYQVASALEQYYNGQSINQVRNNLNNTYGYFPSSKTVYAWIAKYSGSAIQPFKDYFLDVGDIWALTEMSVKLNGVTCWCNDILDTKTAFLLASRLSRKRTKQDIKLLLDQALARSGKSPVKVLTNGWKGYRDVIQSDLAGIQGRFVMGSFGDAESNKWLECWRAVETERFRTLGRLKSLDTAQQFLEGFYVYYNFLRTDVALGGHTPAERANVHYTVRSWLDIAIRTDPNI